MQRQTTGARRAPVVGGEAMTDRPILFSGEMVRAILEGHKTQTRRVIDFRERFPGDSPHSIPDSFAHIDGGGNWVFWSGGDSPGLAEFTKKAYPNGEGFECPYGKPGDTLWVRETWAIDKAWDTIKPSDISSYWGGLYYRATGDNPAGKWRPSIFMPRWASRISLLVKAVRAERVQEISHDTLWDSINAPRGYGWSVNPWVWVIEFEVKR